MGKKESFSFFTLLTQEKEKLRIFLELKLSNHEGRVKKGELVFFSFFQNTENIIYLLFIRVVTVSFFTNFKPSINCFLIYETS